MSLPLYLDDCIYVHRLRQLLIEAAHCVQTPDDVIPPLTDAHDSVHFAHVCSTKQIILTYNANDFLKLHKRYPLHPGILVVYQDNDPAKDMTLPDIVRAIANLEATGIEIAAGFWSLNAFRWSEQP